jgi:hypothetical protein
MSAFFNPQRAQKPDEPIFWGVAFREGWCCGTTLEFGLAGFSALDGLMGLCPVGRFSGSRI